MSSTLQRVRLDPPLGRSSDEPLPSDLNKRTWPPNKPPSFGKRSLRRLLPSLITFCIGVAATLAWQSARQMNATSAQVLGWLAAQTAPLVQPASDRVARAELAAVRQSIDQLAAKQQQMAADIATMQAAQQVILRKVSMLPPPSPRQAATPAHNTAQN